MSLPEAVATAVSPQPGTEAPDRISRSVMSFSSMAIVSQPVSSTTSIGSSVPMLVWADGAGFRILTVS